MFGFPGVVFPIVVVAAVEEEEQEEDADNSNDEEEGNLPADPTSLPSSILFVSFLLVASMNQLQSSGFCVDHAALIEK